MFEWAKNAWRIISRWLVPTWVVASILGLIVAYAWEPDGPSVLETQSDQIDRKCTQYRESESERTQSGTRLVDELYKWSCEPEQQTEYEQNHADSPPRSSTDADLLAQERVAYWTFWIGIFTGFGLVALVGTLIETRNISDITRDVGQNQLRAYLTMRIRIADKDAEGAEIFVIEVTNNGQTPARNVAMPKRSFEVVDSNGSGFRLENSHRNSELKIEIPPNSKEDWLQGKFDDAVFDPIPLRQAAHSATAIKVEVCLIFTDIFSRKFKYSIIGDFMPVKGHNYLHSMSMECLEIQIEKDDPTQ